MAHNSTCPGCGAAFADAEGPIHRYMHSSPACWTAFGEVLTREYSDPAYAEVHRLTVDAYAVQHPGDTSRQAIQSVGLHLVRLCCFIERGLLPGEANAAMLMAGRQKASYVWLTRPTNMGAVTVKDVLAARGLEQHKNAVHSWARSAWNAWAEHHSLVRRWADAA